jgi:hypothetical protein
MVNSKKSGSKVNIIKKSGSKKSGSKVKLIKKSGSKKSGSKQLANKNVVKLSPLLTKLGLGNFFKKGPSKKNKMPNQNMTKQHVARFIANKQNMHKQHVARFIRNKTRRKLKFRPRPMKKNPIKMVIPPWINKKYIKKGRVDWESYSK